MALAALLGLAVLCATFDWTWCRPLIRHYVMARSGRSVDFDALSVHFRHGLDPTIEFRGLAIQNAPWAASKAPFIRAGRAAATISWRSLGPGLTVVELVELEDADVDMERLADGLRNWRITRPDDRGPPRVQVLALDARRSRLHLMHRGIALELDARTTPLPAPRTLPAHADLPLTKDLAFSGHVRGHAFEGEAAVSDVLGFGATPRMFALQGSTRVGALHLDAAGLSNDVHALGDVDLDATLTSASDADAWPLPATLARLRPLSAQGHVAKAGDRWTATAVRLRAGRQGTALLDAVFTGDLHSTTPRRTLQATLRDAVIDVDALWPPRAEAPAGTHAEAPGPALSTRPLPLDRLRAFDADVDLRDARLVSTRRDVPQRLRGRIHLAAGVLALPSLDAGLADGHVTGSLTLDASSVPAELALDLSARGLRVEQLSSALARDAALAGALDGHAALRLRGESPRELVASANGTVSLSLASGASVSKRLDAKLGLNGGEWLRTLFDKSARVPVQCATVELALARGVATPRRLAFETPATALAASGSLDLAGQTLDLTLTPRRKTSALLALDRAIHVEGPWHGTRISLVPATGEAPQRCP